MSVPIHDRCARACRGFVEVVLEMFLQGISLSEMEAMMAVARLESGGQLVGDLDQEVMLSWAAMVFLTLQAIGLPMTASGVLPHPSMRMLPRLAQRAHLPALAVAPGAATGWCLGLPGSPHSASHMPPSDGIWDSCNLITSCTGRFNHYFHDNL